MVLRCSQCLKGLAWHRPSVTPSRLGFPDPPLERAASPVRCRDVEMLRCHEMSWDVEMSVTCLHSKIRSFVFGKLQGAPCLPGSALAATAPERDWGLQAAPKRGWEKQQKRKHIFPHLYFLFLGTKIIGTWEEVCFWQRKIEIRGVMTSEDNW